ncbi:helix-turn-helix transcriptional regulator [Acetobacteraceae bacterium KSS8]|uniref:Helix-turn-helix transcriptional regulator n=1 Tax=Endosaccharibacter trunci TaxID=2812733 RepID=A0ABT1W1W6_9PROT|nr:helix-turn-helix transcriptional regulator [Acetobacteraceae bacterium KSS8]
MTHEELWRALDTLAAEKGLSPSGLARAAGLDPTSFNRSKRFGPTGPRWPSTESLSRVLAATGISLDSFAALVSGARVLRTVRAQRGLPVLAFSALTGHPPDAARIQAARDRVTPPRGGAETDYLVRLDDPRFAPALPPGALLLLSPGRPVGPGDRAIGFSGIEALCVAVEDDAPRRLDTNAALPAGCVLHRIGWIGLE